MVGGAVLHHVTMSYDIDADKMLEVLRIGREKLSDKGTRARTSVSTRCARQTQLPREAVIAAFAATSGGRYPTVDGGLRPEELERATELMRDQVHRPGVDRRVP